MRGQRSGSGEPSALSSQVTLNDPEIGRPRLPEEEHSFTTGVRSRQKMSRRRLLHTRTLFFRVRDEI